MSRAVLQPMIDAGYGRIVNISSVIGETGNIGQANYAAAKSGPVRPDEDARARDGAPAASPSTASRRVSSPPTWSTAVPEEVLANVVADIPVGRLGEPEEVARVVEFLVDPDAGYITGSVVSVNGGLNM